VIRTGDYEVVHASQPTKRPSGQPRAMEPQGDDEDRTLLFSGLTRTMLPPRAQGGLAQPQMKAPKAPNMNLRGLVRTPEPKAASQDMRGAVRRSADAEDRTILRPMSTLPPALLQKPTSATPPAPKPAAAPPPAMMPTPYMPIKPSAPPPGIAVNAPGGSDAKRAHSEPPGDPPSSVITAKTRVLRQRSSMSWAAALMALGAFVGLMTAVVARGDADAIIDAAASFVDPSHASVAHANAAAAQAAVLPLFIDASKKAAPLGTDQNPAPGACLTGSGGSEMTVSTPVVVNTPPAAAPHAVEAERKTASITGSDPKEAARPAPPKAASVAYAAPRPSHHASAAPPAAAPARDDSSSSGWLANVTPPNAGGPIARPSKAAKSGSSDFESAAAADALAKAQLEASLR
jgi:hypothetical protein